MALNTLANPVSKAPAPDNSFEISIKDGGRIPLGKGQLLELLQLFGKSPFLFLPF